MRLRDECSQRPCSTLELCPVGEPGPQPPRAVVRMWTHQHTPANTGTRVIVRDFTPGRSQRKPVRWRGIATICAECTGIWRRSIPLARPRSVRPCGQYSYSGRIAGVCLPEGPKLGLPCEYWLITHDAAETETGWRCALSEQGAKSTPTSMRTRSASSYGRSLEPCQVRVARVIRTPVLQLSSCLGPPAETQSHQARPIL